MQYIPTVLLLVPGFLLFLAVIHHIHVVLSLAVR